MNGTHRVDQDGQTPREDAMTHKIAVFGSASGSRVVPGELVASNDDTIEITGIDSEIIVWFPWKPRAGSLETGSQGKPVCLKVQRMKPGVYQYGVYHVDTRSQAQGHSSPIIIIER